MKKVLITGGAGFIGSHLIKRLLNKKYEVVVFDNLSLGRKEFIEPYLDNPRFFFVKLDLLDKETLLNSLPHDIDTVFHLAANSDISKGAIDTSIDFRNTTIATYNLLEAMKAKKIKRVFYTSGSGVYGNAGSTYTKETFGPLFPVSIYAATKLSAEAFISAFVHLYDMQAWIVRPANIIGPRSTHGVIFDFIRKLRSNPKQLQILGDGQQSKSYIYIDDVLDAFFLIWKRGKKPISLYNLTSADFITVTEIANIIIGTMGLRKVKLIYTGGNVGWKGDVPKVRLSQVLIKKLGWSPKYTTNSAVVQTVKDLLKEL